MTDPRYLTRSSANSSDFFAEPSQPDPDAAFNKRMDMQKAVRDACAPEPPMFAPTERRTAVRDGEWDWGDLSAEARLPNPAAGLSKITDRTLDACETYGLQPPTFTPTSFHQHTPYDDWSWDGTSEDVIIRVPTSRTIRLDDTSQFIASMMEYIQETIANEGR
jgi:hypothetical protein